MLYHCGLLICGACKSVLSAQWTTSWSIIIILFTPPPPPYLCLSFFLKFPQLSFSGHSFFPGFYLIVFEKGLVAHPEPDGRPHSVLPTWKQCWVRERRMAWSCFTHWWSELVRWAMVQDGEGRSGQKQALGYKQTQPHSPSSSFFSLFHTPSLMPCVIPVFTPSDC